MTAQPNPRNRMFLVLSSMTVMFLSGTASSVKADILDEIEASLNDDVLSKFYPACKDEFYGGFLSDFNYDWSYGDLSVRKLLVSQARHIYTASLASQLYPDNPLYPETALHGYRFLRDKMRDQLFGGYHYTASRDATFKHWHNGWKNWVTAPAQASSLYGRNTIEGSKMANSVACLFVPIIAALFYRMRRR